MGEKKDALKCLSGKIKHFKTIFFFLLMENQVLENPSLMENSIDFFLTLSLS